MPFLLCVLFFEKRERDIGFFFFLRYMLLCGAIIVFFGDCCIMLYEFRTFVIGVCMCVCIAVMWVVLYVYM